MAFYYMNQLVNNPFRLNFVLNDLTLSQYQNQSELIGEFENITELQNSYILLQSINIWLYVIALLFDFTFSDKLAVFPELIQDSLFDFVFFILLFSLVNCFLSLSLFLMRF